MDLFFKISWWQTISINLKAFPFKDAIKCSLVVFKGYKIKEFKGSIRVNVPLHFGLVGFGQPYEIFSRTNHTGEAIINGLLEINGSVQLGIDTKLYILEKGFLKFGQLNSFATKTQIICFNEVVFGDYVQSGGECVFVDTNFHDLVNLETNQKISRDGSIIIGSYNYIGIRTIIRSNTITPNHCMIASNSLCNKDYTIHGEKLLLAGMPINKIKKNIVRDWDNEKSDLEAYLKIKLI